MLRSVVFASVLFAVVFGQLARLADAQPIHDKAQPAPSKTPYYPTIYIYQETRRGLRLDNDGSLSKPEAPRAESRATARVPEQEKGSD